MRTCHLSAPLTTLAVVLALIFGGCGSSVGSENAEVVAALSEARELLRQAHQGFQTGSPRQPVEEYRANLYQKAQQTLERVKNDGTPTQQVAVQRLLAQVRQAQADRLTRLAVARWGDLAIRQAQLSSLLLKAQQASLERSAMRSNESQLQQVLSSTQQELANQAESLRQQQSTLEQAIQANRSRARAVTAEADAQSANAQRLRDQAFVASGQQRYDLELASLEAQRLANAALTEADSLDSELNLSLSPQLQIVQRQLQTVAQMQQQSKADLDALRQRGQRAGDLQRAAQQRGETALADLRQAWEQTLHALQTEVQANLDAAQENATTAVTLAEAASRQAQRRNEAKADVLAAQMQLAHTQVTAAGLLSASASALGQLAQAVQAVAPPSASYFVDSAAQLDRRVSAARQTAKASLTAARQTALEMADSATEETSQRLQQYLDRIQALENQLAGRPRKAPAAAPAAAHSQPSEESSTTDMAGETSPAEPSGEPADDESPQEDETAPSTPPTDDTQIDK